VTLMLAKKKCLDTPAGTNRITSYSLMDEIEYQSGQATVDSRGAIGR